MVLFRYPFMSIAPVLLFLFVSAGVEAQYEIACKVVPQSITVGNWSVVASIEGYAAAAADWAQFDLPS